MKLSGALWLELTGVFFGIFAVFASVNAWKMGWALHETAGSRDAYGRLLIAVAMAVVFGTQQHTYAELNIRANRLAHHLRCSSSDAQC